VLLSASVLKASDLTDLIILICCFIIIKNVYGVGSISTNQRLIIHHIKRQVYAFICPDLQGKD